MPAVANPARAEYVARINRVIDYINTHIGEPLALETLAAVAHFSPFHFHRVFSAMTGETLADCVRRRRLELAAGCLLAWRSRTVLSIALDLGFASNEVFTRNFHQHFGVTPSGWRKGAWRDWAAARHLELRKFRQADRKNRQAVMTILRDNAHHWHARQEYDGACNMEVTIKQLPDYHVAYLRNTGPYGTSDIPMTWERLNRWCQAQSFGNQPHTMLGVSLDDPKITPPAQCRYDACVEIEPGFKVSGEVGTQTIRGGAYACARFIGNVDKIGPAWQWLFAEWLPSSGYQCDARPCFELYPAELERKPEPGIFVCDICIPIKPLE